MSYKDIPILLLIMMKETMRLLAEEIDNINKMLQEQKIYCAVIENVKLHIMNHRPLYDEWKKILLEDMKQAVKKCIGYCDVCLAMKYSSETENAMMIANVKFFLENLKDTHKRSVRDALEVIYKELSSAVLFWNHQINFDRLNCICSPSTEIYDVTKLNVGDLIRLKHQYVVNCCEVVAIDDKRLTLKFFEKKPEPYPRNLIAFDREYYKIKKMCLDGIINVKLFEIEVLSSNPKRYVYVNDGLLS